MMLRGQEFKQHKSGIWLPDDKIRSSRRIKKEASFNSINAVQHRNWNLLFGDSGAIGPSPPPPGAIFFANEFSNAADSIAPAAADNSAAGIAAGSLSFGGILPGIIQQHTVPYDLLQYGAAHKFNTGLYAGKTLTFSCDFVLITSITNGGLAPVLSFDGGGNTINFSVGNFNGGVGAGQIQAMSSVGGVPQNGAVLNFAPNVKHTLKYTLAVTPGTLNFFIDGALVAGPFNINSAFYGTDNNTLDFTTQAATLIKDSYANVAVTAL